MSDTSPAAGAQDRATDRATQVFVDHRELLFSIVYNMLAGVTDTEDVLQQILHPRAVGDGAAELLALARERGVQRVVVLSAMNVDDPLDPLDEQPSRRRGDRNKEVEAAAVDQPAGQFFRRQRAAGLGRTDPRRRCGPLHVRGVRGVAGRRTGSGRGRRRRAAQR